MGRLTKDPDVRFGQGENAMQIARYTLAVDRRGKDGGADFISCVAFGKQADFADKYLNKGTKIAITGHIQTGSYTNKDGQKVYTTDVVVDEQEFAESKKDDAPKTAPSTAPAPTDNGWMTIPDGEQEEFPWD